MTEVKYRTSIGDSWHLVRFATEQDAQAWIETKTGGGTRPSGDRRRGRGIRGSELCVMATPSTVQTRREKRRWTLLECRKCGRRELVPPGSSGWCPPNPRHFRESVRMDEVPE